MRNINPYHFSSRDDAECVCQWMRIFADRFNRITWDYYFDLIAFTPVGNDTEKYLVRGWDNRMLDDTLIKRDADGWWLDFPKDKKFTYEELKELKTLLDENAERRAAEAKFCDIPFSDTPFFESIDSVLKKRLQAAGERIVH